MGQRQHITVRAVWSVPLGCPLIKALHFLLTAGSNQARVVRTTGLLSCSAVWVRCRAAGQVPPNSSSKQKFDIFLPNKQPAHILFFALLTPVLLIFTPLLSNSVIQVVVSSPGKPRPLIFISFVIPHTGEFMYSPFTSVMSRSFSHCCLTGLAPSWGQPSIVDSLLLSAVASSLSRLLPVTLTSLAVCMHTSVLTEE